MKFYKYYIFFKCRKTAITIEYDEQNIPIDLKAIGVSNLESS